MMVLTGDDFNAITMAEVYSHPSLRQRIKQRIHSGTKGGKAGHWSARKSQLLNHEYQKQTRAKGLQPFRAGAKLGKSQRSLRKWSRQKWQTSDKKKTATTKAGFKRRYLPERVWKRMSRTEIRKTNRKKLQGGRRGLQYVRK